MTDLSATTFTGFADHLGGNTCVVRIPDELFSSLWNDGHRRVMVAFKDGPINHLALRPRKNEESFLYLSRSVMKGSDILPGEEFEVSIRPDTSKYQAPEPEEWMELLRQDVEIMHRFESLTMGQKRSVLFMVDKLKSPEARIKKAFRIADHLRMGKTDPMEFNK